MICGVIWQYPVQRGRRLLRKLRQSSDFQKSIQFRKFLEIQSEESFKDMNRKWSKFQFRVISMNPEAGEVERHFSPTIPVDFPIFFNTLKTPYLGIYNP